MKNRFSLCYDISEIFKPILVDRLVFMLVNRKIITNDDFDSQGMLNKEAIKKIFTKWDAQINTTIYHRELKRYVNYRYLIRYELIKLEKHILGKGEYKPFVLWW